LRLTPQEITIIHTLYLVKHSFILCPANITHQTLMCSMQSLRGIRLLSRRPLAQSLRLKPDAHRLRPAYIHPRYSSTGYGDDSADSHGKDPLAQGVSPRTRELEHPGPSQHKSSRESKAEKGPEGSRGGKKHGARGSVKEGSNHDNSKNSH
jgi:hypothetical protein